MKYSNEDTNLNDFLYCCEIFGERPSKVVLAFSFKSKEFLDYFKGTIVNKLTEIIPDYEVSIINQKYLSKLTDNIFMAYTHIDSLIEDSNISNVIFYYKTINDNTTLEQYLKDMDNFISDSNGAIHKITYASINDVNLMEFKPLKLMELDYENINNYFNESIIKSINKLIKNINKNIGLSILHGKKGVGKTSLLHYIANKVEKEVVFIPISMIDMTINNPSFKEQDIEDMLIIIDDCEIFTDNFKSNITFANILQMVDGFFAHNININILLSFNVEEEDDIYEDLLNSNSLLDIVKIGELKKNKANKLIEYLKLKGKVETDVILIDILNNNYKDNPIKIGYQ